MPCHEAGHSMKSLTLKRTEEVDQQAIANDGFVPSDLYCNVVDKGVKASLNFLNEGQILR